MPSIDTFSIAIFWICAGLVFYAYFAYPVLIRVLSTAFGRAPRPTGPGGNVDPPSISLIVAAHNEEAVIGERVVNALDMDYPQGKLEVIIGSDGSVDRTAEIVRGYEGRGVRLLEFKQNRGKAAVLNAAMAEARGEIVLLSDANTYTDADAARKLVRWFADPSVGAVCGRLVLTDAHTGRNVDSLYWRYETFLKKCEGRLGALLGSNGAIYAIRRELYVPIPENTIVDDFVIPLLARIRHDRSIVYDSEAIAREETAPDLQSEFRRRIRIGAGGFQAIGLLWRLLSPRHGWVTFTFFSHKILRWLCPFFMIGMLVANALLLGHPFYRWAFVAQVAFYLSSSVTSYLPAGPKSLRLLRLTTMFVGMNAALLLGFFRWLRGNQRGTWQRTARLVEGKDGATRGVAL